MDLIGLVAMVYEPLYHAREIKRALNCLLVVLAKQNRQDLAIFLIVFNKTIIPLALV